MNVGLLQLDRKTNSLAPLSHPAERGEGDKPETQEGKGQRALAAASRFLHPSAGVTATGLTTDRKAGRESRGLPSPRQLTPEGRQQQVQQVEPLGRQS